MSDNVDPNREQIEFWNGLAAQRWVNEQERLDRAFAGLDAAAIERAAPAAGERVIDVGCGCGGSTLQLAKRVGPSGTVLGVDISAPMLARARERTQAMPWVTLREADASRHGFTGDANLIYSRFGVMFFADPRTAFANLRSALAKGGRLCVMAWRNMSENPWYGIATEAGFAVMGADPQPGPEAPGPFSFARAERVQDILEAAGFQEIAIEPYTSKLVMSDTGLDEAVEFCLRATPLSRILLPATDAQKAQVIAEVRKRLTPHIVGNTLALDASVWWINARK